MRIRDARATRTIGLSLAVLLLAAQPLAASAAEPPANDDRGDATLVSGVPFSDVVDVSDATVEDDEPGPSCLAFDDGEEIFNVPLGHTVWYAVTLPRRTQVLVDTAGSGYDTVATVYTTDLDEVACNDDAGSLQSRVGFTAEAGRTYLVQIGSYGGAIDPEWDDPTLVVSIDRGREINRQPRLERYSFQGQIAESFGFEENRWFGVVLQDGRYSSSFQRGPQRVRAVDVYSYTEEIDEEKQTVTFTDWWGYETLTNGDIGRRLDAAYVDQDVTLWGYTCTGPIVDWDEIDEDDEVEFDCIELGQDVARVDVDWTGVGSTSRINVRERYVDEWGTYMFSYRATSREADVRGSVTGEQVSISLEDAEYGFLADVAFSDSLRPRIR